MGVCNPACWKIILNGSLVAEAAKLLGANTEDKDVQRAARKLGLAADTLIQTWGSLRSMHAINEPKLKPSQWKGCDEAASVVAMIGLGADSKFVTIARLEELEAQTITHLGMLVRGEKFGEEEDIEEAASVNE